MNECHKIEIIDGAASFAFVGQKAWHGLGFELPEGATAPEMQKAAGLDWEVKKYPLIYRRAGDNCKTESEALVRESDGKLLSVVSDGWNPVQNSEAFDFFASFCDRGEMTMETAGSLKGGKMVWALAKVKDGAFKVGKKDEMESYMLFSNPHEYGKSVEVRLTNIRVVCNNTLTWALNKETANKIRLNHSKAFNADIVTETLGLSEVKRNEMKAKAEFLASKSYTPEQMTEYLNRLFPLGGDNVRKKEISKPAATIRDLLDTQPGAEFAPGSFWNLFNGVTYATDHVLGRNEDTRLSSAWFGVNQEKKIKALNMAVEMAEAA